MATHSTHTHYTKHPALPSNFFNSSVNYFVIGKLVKVHGEFAEPKSPESHIAQGLACRHEAGGCDSRDRVGSGWWWVTVGWTA